MTPVTPLEPHLRRRTTTRRPPRVDTFSERVVPIPVHREDGRPPIAVEAPIDTRFARQAALSERALAGRFFPVVGLVVAADLATKAWATASLATRSVPVANGVSLALSFNRASAGGVSIGAHTREVNFIATGVVVGLLVMIVPTLTKLHRRAWIAAALIVGAGLGNLVSLASDERGVADFIALRGGGGTSWVLNVADVSLLVGLALLAWTAAVLARAARRGAARVRVI